MFLGSKTNYNAPYISVVERTDGRFYRFPIIIHNAQWHFARFNTMEQLDFIAETLGFSYELRDEHKTVENGVIREYNINRKISDPHCGGFWTRADVPADAKPIKALSNGSIVTCYFTNDGKTITMYRPNPNAKDVYKPLPLEQHIAHERIYGTI